eukprot:1992443-Rhodomonas_salina.2
MVLASDPLSMMSALFLSRALSPTRVLSSSPSTHVERRAHGGGMMSSSRVEIGNAEDRGCTRTIGRINDRKLLGVIPCPCPLVNIAPCVYVADTTTIRISCPL